MHLCCFAVWIWHLRWKTLWRLSTSAQVKFYLLMHPVYDMLLLRLLIILNRSLALLMVWDWEFLTWYRLSLVLQISPCSWEGFLYFWKRRSVQHIRCGIDMQVSWLALFILEILTWYCLITCFAEFTTLCLLASSLAIIRSVGLLKILPDPGEAMPGAPPQARFQGLTLISLVNFQSEVDVQEPASMTLGVTVGQCIRWRVRHPHTW